MTGILAQLAREIIVLPFFWKTVAATSGPYTGFDFDNYKCVCDTPPTCNFNPCDYFNNFCNNNYNCGSYYNNNNCTPSPCSALR